MTPADALHYGVRDKSAVRVRVVGDRELVFGDVLVRVDPNFALALHVARAYVDVGLVAACVGPQVPFGRAPEFIARSRGCTVRSRPEMRACLW